MVPVRPRACAAKIAGLVGGRAVAALTPRHALPAHGAAALAGGHDRDGLVRGYELAERLDDAQRA